MIEHTAIVIKAEAGKIWLQTSHTANCGPCKENKACGALRLQELFGRRKTLLVLDFEGKASPGDRVVFSVDERTLVSAALRVYFVPLMFALIFALGIDFVTHKVAFGAEWLTLVGAVCGFYLAKTGLGYFSLKSYQAPKILEIHST